MNYTDEDVLKRWSGLFVLVMLAFYDETWQWKVSSLCYTVGYYFMVSVIVFIIFKAIILFDTTLKGLATLRQNQ